MRLRKRLKGQAQELDPEVERKLAAALKEDERRRSDLKDLQAEEERYSRINRHKVQNQWRKLMRIQKVEELIKEVEILSQNHEREVDRKDAIIQMLDRDLEEADEQHQMALRSHLMNVEALTTLQHSRLLAMESHFERDMKMIEEEFCSEFEDMKSTHKRTAKEMRDVNEAIKEEIERQEQELRTDFEGLQADYRGKHEEEKQVMKVTLENAVNEFERQLDNAYNTYYDSTKKQTEKYRELQNKDQKDSRKIDAMQRKCAKLTETLQHWRTKISNNMKEAELRNKALKEEKDKVIGHYQELKGRMNRVRDAEDKRLTELTLNARRTIKDLGGKHNMAEKILKLGELNRKLMTEREKVLPFEHVLPDGTKSDQLMGPGGEQQPGSASSLGMDGKPVEEWVALNNFFTRSNKILLDKVAMDSEDQRLNVENERLRGLIKQFVDGISAVSYTHLTLPTKRIV
eukprot:TRINITY_DN18962_c0_g1_i5.p1 TRINITY_DN18962_c0_g1~~TRINITY_DN18962_c0_g1_i5.p1  ORF type:complete len:459 (-),score=165.05 TRINITY_DN18962_c0_g1_i5:80-1456(-)